MRGFEMLVDVGWAQSVQLAQESQSEEETAMVILWDLRTVVDNPISHVVCVAKRFLYLTRTLEGTLIDFKSCCHAVVEFGPAKVFLILFSI